MKLNERHGFTLLEVLIALVILFVGIVAAWRLFPIAHRNVEIARERTLVSELANERLNRARMLGAEGLRAPGYNFGLDTALVRPTDRALGSAAAVYGLYSGYVTSRNAMPGVEATGLQRLTFTVDMPDGRRETFVTYVAGQ